MPTSQTPGTADSAPTTAETSVPTTAPPAGSAASPPRSATEGAPDRVFLAQLHAWQPLAEAQEALFHEYMALAEEGPNTLLRHPRQEHFTASCFIFSPDFTHVLLCFHGKGKFWVQLGGHIDEGEHVLEAAVREAEEESGLTELTLVREQPVDIDRHTLGTGFSHCTAHWDVGFAVTTSREATVTISAESDDVAWFPVDQLPEQAPSNLPGRIAHALAELRIG